MHSSSTPRIPSKGSAAGWGDRLGAGWHIPSRIPLLVRRSRPGASTHRAGQAVAVLSTESVTDASGPAVWAFAAPTHARNAILRKTAPFTVGAQGWTTRGPAVNCGHAFATPAPPGAQLGRTELEQHPDLRGPAGTTPINRPDYRVYVMGHRSSQALLAS